MSQNQTYKAVTHNIAVSVVPRYLADQSDAAENRFVWSYTIEIRNRGSRTVQLRDRYWEITDETGYTEIVKGPGVVGEQPILAPGERYTYTSGCPLSTPSGFMVGHYTMMLMPSGSEASMADAEPKSFRAAVPAFSLDQPDDTRNRTRLH